MRLHLRLIRTTYVGPLLVCIITAITLVRVAQAADGAIFGYSSRAALAVAVNSLLMGVPVLAGLLASYLFGIHSARMQQVENYLAGVGVRKLYANLGAAVFGVTVVTATIVLLLATISAETVLEAAPRPEFAYSQHSVTVREKLASDVCPLLLVPLLWIGLGAAAGSLGRSPVVGTSLMSGFIAASFVLERVAVSNSWVAEVHALSPLGASSGLVVEMAIPNFEQSAVPREFSVIIAGLWATLSVISTMLTIQMPAALFSREAMDGRDRNFQPIWSVPRFATVVTLGLVSGLMLPPVLSARIPWHMWHMKASWRLSQAEGSTPADAAERLLSAVGRGESPSAVNTDEEAVVRRYRALVEEASLGLQPRNDVGATEPGTVAVDLHAPQVSNDGTVQGARQVSFCFRRDEASSWRLAGVSDRGIPCQGVQ